MALIVRNPLFLFILYDFNLKGDLTPILEAFWGFLLCVPQRADQQARKLAQSTIFSGKYSSYNKAEKRGSRGRHLCWWGGRVDEGCIEEVTPTEGFERQLRACQVNTMGRGCPRVGECL